MNPEVLNEKLRVDLIASQKIPIFMDEMISEEDSTSFRLEYLMRMLNGSKSIPNMKFEWMEEAIYPNIMIAQGASSAGTSITVDHPEYAHQDNLIYNTRTNEIYLMNENTGGTTTAHKITVVNHAAGTGNFVTAVAEGDILIVLPEAHAEGEVVPQGYSSKPRFLYNYNMQIDTSAGPYTDIARGTKEYGEKQLLRNRKNKWIEHKQKKNLLLYLSKRNVEIVSAGGPRRYTIDGLRNSIQTNRVDFSNVGGGFNMAAVAELIRSTTTKGNASKVKAGIAGQNAWLTLSSLPNNAIRTTQGEKSWGWVINKLITPFGDLALEYDPTLTEANGLADVMVMLDMKYVQLTHFADLADRMYLDVTEKRDIHNMEDIISGTVGLELKQQEFHAWGYGIN